MAKNGSKQREKKKVATLTHDKAKRRNIPTAEFQSVMRVEEQSPVRVAYERRNRDLDPQLVWRGKDEQDWSDLVVHAPPLYIQEKVQPKALIDDLQRQTEADNTSGKSQIDLFADFNGLPSDTAKTEFYQHDAHWSNRMILGDSLQVMASLGEREGLLGQVQCIYIDPPYGIKFNSNFQWSTTTRDVKDGNSDHITREPEQVKAFRDTWRDGVHTYLTYLRDRLTIARDLLTDSGSIFVQIGDENVHRVMTLMDEIFGPNNRVSLITVKKTGGLGSNSIKNVTDFVVWYCKNEGKVKWRKLMQTKALGIGASTGERYDQLTDAGQTFSRPLTTDERDQPTTIPEALRAFRYDNLISSGATVTCIFPQEFEGATYSPGGQRSWKTNKQGMERLIRARRVASTGKSIQYKRFLDDFPAYEINNIWEDISVGTGKIYVVETPVSVIQRCVLMSTDPGDLVLDPTCGSGTTAYVAEQWGRRWITIETSRVALALARARIMGARYPYYTLADSRAGQLKEAEITETVPSETPVHENVRLGFVWERVPHVTLRSIANNAEIDVIWDEYQKVLEPLRQKLNTALKVQWEEWEIPRETSEKWNPQAKEIHAEWWKRRIARQKAVDASIASKTDFEYLYDKPYEDNKRVRVAGPFTVESLSPHRVVIVDDNGDWIDGQPQSKTGRKDEADFVQMILENLRTAGVQQAHKEDKISFSSIAPWPGYFVCAEGKYAEGIGKSSEKRAAIFIGPEFGTVARPDLVAAAREAGDAGFDVLITCAFNYDAHSSEFNKLGRIPVLKARMNADLHMSDELKNTGKGNLFVIFGEPDIDIINLKSGELQLKVKGVDVFHPNTGEVRSDGAEGIACWFIDTDYNEESFFVRHAYFLGANDPYKALKTSLKAEINQEAWLTLHSDTSRPFTKPTSGRIAVKVINHLGDEVMKVFRVN
jgi:adenine-specific DNA-methyltransferase